MSVHQESRVVVSAPERSGLAEIWGDIVRRKELSYAIAIGATVSLAAYSSAAYMLKGEVENADIGRALAMLIGIAGCILGGIVCAFLFKPKREVFDDAGDDGWRLDVLDQLASETGSIGKVADLPEVVISEMKEVGIYDLFANYERRVVQKAVASEPAFQAGPDVTGKKGA